MSNKNQLQKKSTIARMPPLLCLHLNRLDGRLRKFSDVVKFDAELDLYAYTTYAIGSFSSKSNHRHTNNECDIFRLQYGLDPCPSSVVHTGPNLLLPPEKQYNDRWRQDSLSKTIKYNLVAVIVHSGNAITGHYIAYRKRLTNNIIQDAQGYDNFIEDLLKQASKSQQVEQWVYISDDQVTFVKESEVLTKQAYCLYYERTG